MIVLDTHALIWWVDSPIRLSNKARKLIEHEIKTSEVLISSISVWEIYMLVRKQRLQFTIPLDDWLERVESLPNLKFVPVNNRIASLSVNLPGNLHEDPADRIIAATALKYGATLVTGDKRLLKYPHIQTIW